MDFIFFFPFSRIRPSWTIHSLSHRVGIVPPCPLFSFCFLNPYDVYETLGTFLIIHLIILNPLAHRNPFAATVDINSCCSFLNYYYYFYFLRVFFFRWCSIKITSENSFQRSIFKGVPGCAILRIRVVVVRKEEEKLTISLREASACLYELLLLLFATILSPRFTVAGETLDRVCISYFPIM